jgi:hypothetical protein
MRVSCKLGLGLDNIEFNFKLYTIFKTQAQTAGLGLTQRVSWALVKLLGTEAAAAEPGANEIRQIRNILLAHNQD